MTTNNQTKLSFSLNLVQQAPRSPHTRLGGFALLPRLIDKCRADIMGNIGEYLSDCAIDQEFLKFTGIDYEALRAQIAEDKTDYEILQWVRENSSPNRAAWEISQWTQYQERRAPEPHTEAATYFLDVLQNLNSKRGDITGWSDLLDLDDYCSFGGRA